MSTQRPPAPPPFPSTSGPRLVETKAPASSAPPLSNPDERVTAPGALPPEPSPESRRDRHRRETFERLVRAAREIMFSRGFNDITVQDITEAADVGKGTFFNYFRSKEHIVTRVQEYNRRGLVVALERVRSGEKSPQEAMTGILTWLLCPTGGNWLTYQSNTMRALALHPEVREYFSPELRSNEELYTQIMEVAQQQRKVRTDIPPTDLARVTQTFFSGVTVLYWIHGIAPTPSLVADMVAKLFTMLAPIDQAVPTEAPATPVKTPKRPSSPRQPAAKRQASARRKTTTPVAARGGARSGTSRTPGRRR